jgi:diguanylate cyclase (GGDEF)-like protein
MRDRAILANISQIPSRRLVATLLFLFSLAALAQHAPITKAGEVHDLPGALAAQQLPVHLTATVTYYEPAESTLFVADSSGAVYVKTSHPYPIHRGDLVRIDGVTAQSFRTTVAKDPNIAVIGKGAMHRENIRTYESYRELMSGKWDCQYVVMQGKVRSALIEPRGNSKVLELEVMMPGGIVQAYLQDYKGIDIDRLDDAEIELSGIVAGDFNAQWQLMRSVIYAADSGDLRILHAPQVQPNALPLTAIDDVMQNRSINDRTPRVRVRGIVTFYQAGNAVVIQQGDRGLYANTRYSGVLPIGSVVDLVGFAGAGSYSPSLTQTEVIPTGQFAAITPIPVSYQQAIGGSYSDNVVSVTGRLIAQLHTDTSDTLSLMVDQHPVTAVLLNPSAGQSLARLPIGALVSVSGICRITSNGAWGTPGLTPMLFQIDMRYRDDLQVLALPSWWTVAHLLLVVCALFALSVLIASWAVILRRRVAQQTATIERTMRLERERSRLLEAINSESSLDELLSGICTAIDALVPGLICCCTVSDLSFDTTESPRTLSVGELCAAELFQSWLTDSKGRQIGTFHAGGDRPRSLSKYENEVLKVGAGLANLAVNQRRLYQDLNYTSTHDQLTGLPNRRLSDLSLDSAIEQAASNGSRVAVAYIDVDRFKQVNDQHGHKIGDLYLQQIATRLASTIRNTDKIARIGGDEFLVIATGLRSSEDAEIYRGRLSACFDETFLLDNCRVCGSASIGVAIFPDHGSGAEELKRHADADMYAAKSRQRTEHEQWSHKSGQTDIFSRADLELALENEGFSLFYQPQFSSRGELRGLEALIRLEDPILGSVSPDAFIGVAERNELILPLGDWVLRRALADAARWRFDTLPNVRMVVNVSARQIEHSLFAHQVIAALHDCGLPARCLELEITERTLARDTAEAASQLQQLHAAGIQVSIDDFGTDHSCLSILHRFPIDTLKIDRSFVRAIHSEPEVRHILRAIISMGHAMNKRIVAEGVETEQDIAVLLGLANMDLQGYFFSRPQSAQAVTGLLAKWTGGVAVPRELQR